MKSIIRAGLAMAMVTICVQQRANAQSEEYQTEFNACFDGKNAEYCHCITNQAVNRGADAIFAIQYCLESTMGIKASQSDISDYLNRSNALQKNTEGCAAVGRQRLPQYSGQINDFCSCVTRKLFLERLSRNVSFKSCAIESRIPW